MSVTARGLRAVVAIAGTGVALAACGSSGKGNVSVLYAGSLADLMEHHLGPAFARASGYGYEGFAAGSTELVSQIKSKVRRGDVFISASPDADKLLEGSANGNYVRWYVTFAKAPLVIGYNPHSQFASQFKTKPWYDVVTEPGIKVGRTDPKLDPKGKLTVAAVGLAAHALRNPRLLRALVRFPVFPEEDLVGRLEAGQLDAGFFYSVEAAGAHIPTVSLRPTHASATYTVTILKGAPNSTGAAAFVSYFLGSRGMAILSSNGLDPTRLSLTGPKSAPPPGVRGLLGG